MKKKLLYFSMILSCALYVEAKDPKATNPVKGAAGVTFTENKGQVHDQFNKARPDVLFGGTDGDLVFHLRKNGISYQLTRIDNWETVERQGNRQGSMQPETRKKPGQIITSRLDLNWLNANPTVIVTQAGAFAGHTNYYLENCPGGVKGVKTYEEVTYHALYPGIDLKWYQQDGHLKYDYIVTPGADYKKIRLQIKGFEEIHLDESGQLVIKTPLGEISEQAPLVKQGSGILPSKWIIEKNKEDNSAVISFEVSNLDRSRAFTIDPLVRAWGTYYGGNGDEYASGAVDASSGASFLVGETGSTTGTIIATSGSIQDTYFGGYSDAFLVKFDPSGQRLWGTYFGGAGDDYPGNCAVDAAGFSFMCGTTNSGPNIMATAGSHQPGYGGNQDCFLAKFDGSGNLYWSTYYGGTGTDYVSYCAVDKTGNVMMCGNTGSTGNIASGASHQPSKGSASFPPFFVKFNSAGVRQWGTYYGGTSGVSASQCSADKQGNVYLTGRGVSAGTNTMVATPGTHQQTYAGGTGNDAFLVKFDASGARQWGTFYGGPDDEFTSACFADSVGNVFLPGSTKSTSGIATAGAYQTVYGGGASDGFLVKLNSSGQRLWATYYGGTGSDGFNGRLDKYENILLGGGTTSATGTVIATPGSYQPTYGGGANDLFIVKMTPAGKRVWGTYYGGSGEENGSIAGFDNSGNLFLAGYTTGTNGISTPGTHQPANGGGAYDGFMVKFNYCSPPIPVNNTPSVNLVICEGEEATLMATATGTLSWFAAETGGTSLGSGTPFVTPALTSGTYTYYVEAETCAPGEVRTAISLTVNACTGIAVQSSAETKTSIYPNPFLQKITITCSSTEPVPVKIFNAAGALIYESLIKNQADIDLGNQAPGIYLVKIGTTTKKIVRE